MIRIDFFFREFFGRTNGYGRKWNRADRRCSIIETHNNGMTMPFLPKEKNTRNAKANRQCKCDCPPYSGKVWKHHFFMSDFNWFQERKKYYFEKHEKIG